MQEKNKISLSHNFLVISTALWLFAMVFLTGSAISIFLINSFSLKGLAKSINESIFVLILSILVFGIFTALILVSEKFIFSNRLIQSHFKSKHSLDGFSQYNLLITTGIIFLISAAAIYFGLGWIIAIFQNLLS